MVPLVYLIFEAAGLLIAIGSAVLAYGMLRPPRVTYATALARGMATDPTELGLVGREVEFRLADGATTGGWVIDGVDAAGPLVVVTHGWSGSRYGSLARAPVAVRHASRVVVYDMRGHGESTAPISRLGTTEVADLIEIVEQADPGGRDVVLFGSSMGAGASIVAAARAERECDWRVAGVIAEAPYRVGTEPIFGHLRERRLPTFLFVWIACGYVGWRLGGFRGFDRAGHAARLACPLLVMHGDADAICRFESGQQIAAAAPHGEFVNFPGGAHGDLRRSHEQLYVKTIDDWFARLIGQAEIGADQGQPITTADRPATAKVNP